jgi:hypothetical protein
VTFARELLDASPLHVTQDVAELAAAIDACLTSAQACTACADADSVEDDLADLGNCIALTQECADVCTITARVLSRPAHWDHFTVDRLLQACARICRLCAEECVSGTPTTATAPSASRNPAPAWTRAAPFWRPKPSRNSRNSKKPAGRDPVKWAFGRFRRSKLETGTGAC